MIDHLLSALEITYRSWRLFSVDSRKLLICCCGAKSRLVYQEVAATPSASRRAARGTHQALRSLTHTAVTQL